MVPAMPLRLGGQGGGIMAALMLTLIGGSLCFLVYFLIALFREERIVWMGYWLQLERNTQLTLEMEDTLAEDGRRGLARAA